MSIGGGVILLVCAVIAAFLADQYWARLACRLYAGVYFILAVGSVVVEGRPSSDLLVPMTLLVFALYVMEIHKGVRNSD